MEGDDLDDLPAYRERRSAVLSGTVWRARVAAGPAQILPDGCMDLIWDGERILIAGPDRTVAEHVTPRSTVLTAVRFDPGIAPTAIGAPAVEFTDRRVDLAEVWTAAQLAPWLEQLHRAERPGAALAALAVHRLRRGTPLWVPHVVDALDRGATVEAVAADVGVTSRQLHRWSRTRFGYGPKTLQRILRMRRALRLLGGSDDASAVAHDAGYSDYAHLFREFRALTGTSPAAFG